MTEPINPYQQKEVKYPDNNQGYTKNAQNGQASVFSANNNTSVNDNQKTGISNILQNNADAEEKEKKAEQKVNTTYTKVKQKGNGLSEIAVYEDKGQKEPKETQECFIFKTGKNEKKFKFKSGNRNAIDFIDNGNEVSIEVSKGNRSRNFTVKKNKDGTYEIGSKKYNSIEEMAVKLNKIKLDYVEAADGNINVFKQDSSSGMPAGDCSLLSALTAISHSGEYGKKVIEEAFDINLDENKITVNLPGFNSSYTYDLSDSNEYNRQYYYSTGDVEAYFLERALNDALDEVKSGKIKLSKDAPDWCKRPREIASGNGIHGLEPDQVFYALTGLECNDRLITFAYDKKGNKVINKEAQKWFNKNAQDESTSIVASRRKKKGEASKGNGNSLFNNSATYISVKDAFGEDIRILEGHSYALKDVSTKSNGEKLTTIIDPYDTSKEYIMTEKTFMDTFNFLNSITLKGNNKRPKYYN